MSVSCPIHKPGKVRSVSGTIGMEAVSGDRQARLVCTVVPSDQPAFHGDERHAEKRKGDARHSAEVARPCRHELHE